MFMFLLCWIVLFTYLCTVKQSSPYLHNDIQYKVKTSYVVPTGKNGQGLPWLLSFCPVLLHCTFTHVSISILTETSNFGSVLCCNRIAWISAGSLHFCKPQTCWNFTFLYVTTFDPFILWQYFGHTLFRIRHKFRHKHTLGLGKENIMVWREIPVVVSAIVAWGVPDCKIPLDACPMVQLQYGFGPSSGDPHRHGAGLCYKHNRKCTQLRD